MEVPARSIRVPLQYVEQDESKEMRFFWMLAHRCKGALLSCTPQRISSPKRGQPTIPELCSPVPCVKNGGGAGSSSVSPLAQCMMGCKARLEEEGKAFPPPLQALCVCTELDVGIREQPPQGKVGKERMWILWLSHGCQAPHNIHLCCRKNPSAEEETPAATTGRKGSRD